MTRTAWVAAIVLLASAAPGYGSPVVFSDGTFADSDWSFVTFVTGTGSSVQASQAADGNPPPSRTVRNIVGPASSPTTVSEIYGAHFSSKAVYDPSTLGPITTVDFQEDAILLDGFGDGQATGIALRQNGMVYIRQAGNTPDRVWTRKESLGVPASGVVYVFDGGLDPNQRPDFSASGMPIEFGFYSEDSTLGGSGYQILAAFDNWSVRVNPPCTSAADCVYPDPCLVGACQSGVCQATAAVCNDGDPCTTDVCIAGACTATPLACDDDASCTQDSCSAGACQHDVGFDLIDGALDQLRGLLSTTPCADDIPGKLRKKLDRKLKKAQNKLAGADAATKAKVIATLVGRADSLLGLAQTLLSAAQAAGIVSTPCASGLGALLTDVSSCVAALPAP